MSTVRDPKALGLPRKDPFRYGWRYVRRVLPDGSETFDQVPLTLEDVLHPQEGDFHVLTDEHDDDCSYLKYALRSHLGSKAMVLSDHRVDWGKPGVKPHGPDIAVFFGVRKRKRLGATFYVATEGALPKLNIEVTSPETRKNDVVTKVDEYYRAGVPLYVIVDVRVQQGRRTRLQLIGYRHGPTGYEKMALDERGWLWLEELRVWIGIEGTRVVCFDHHGRKILDYAEQGEARRDAEHRANKAEARAKNLEAENRELQERLRRLERRQQEQSEVEE